MTYTASFLIRKDKIDQNQEAPIFLRIATSTHDRVSCSTGIKIQPSLWKGKKGSIDRRGMTQYIKGTTEKIRQLNLKLDSILSKIQQKENELIKAHLTITAQELISPIKGNSIANYLLSDALEYIVSTKNAKGTKENAKHFKRLLLEFISETYSISDIDVNQLELKAYKGIAVKLGEWGLSRDYSNDYIRKMITMLKNSIEHCIDLGHITNNPTQGYSFKGRKKVVKTAPCLTLKEFICIRDYKIDDGALDMIRDVFLFQCFTGLSYVDTLNLQKEHLIKGKEGRFWIMKKRQKTQSLAKIPLLTEATNIINKYSALPNNDKLLPVKSRAHYNKMLKKLAELAGIQKPISTHSGRYTFSTLLRESDVSLDDIATMLAHSNIAQTQEYASLTDQKLITEIEKLSNRLS